MKSHGNPENLEKLQKFKLVMVGEEMVGKSSLVLRFIRNKFDPYLDRTQGAAFSNKIIEINNNRIMLDIWDTAGQERFRSMLPMYYRNADAAIVVYDVTSQHSFMKCSSWIKELKRYANPNVKILIAGNKIDKVNHREVEFEMGQNYALSESLGFFETSAKSGTNTIDVFLEIAKLLCKEQLPRKGDENIDDTKNVAKNSKPVMKNCCH